MAGAAGTNFSMRSTVLGLILLMVGATEAVAAPKREPVDEAIDRALESLRRSQEPDGAWRDGTRKSPAATGLCLMAFLSAGHVPGEGRHGEAVQKAVDSLAGGLDAARTTKLCLAIKEVEKQNDRLLRSATARLFREEQDPKRLVIWKDIYADVEDAIDACEDVANLVEGVVLENA